MKRITLIHQHFRVPEEGGAIRSYHLANALMKSGWEVQVICSIPSPYHSNCPFPVHALGVNYQSQFGFWKRIQSFIRFAWAARKWCSSHETGLLYLISTPLSVPWIGYSLKRDYILEIGDLWPDVPVQMGFIRNALLKKWLYSWEKKLYQKAKGIVALSPAIEKAIRAKGIRKNIATFTNLANIDFFKAGKAGGERLHQVEFDHQNPFLLLYAGALGRANGLDRILHLAARVKTLPLRFQIMGEGPKKQELEQLAKKLELGNVVFIKHGNKEQTRLIMEKAHAVLVAYADFPLLSTGSPNKFFDGLATGKPLFLTVEGWMMEKVLEYQCGYSFRPEHTQSFVDAISNYLYNSEAFRQACLQASNLAREYEMEKVLSAQLSTMDAWMKE